VYAADSVLYWQAELARMFAKSRMTISKLMRPESIAKVHALAASGVRLDVRRCKRAQYPEIEQRLFISVGRGTRTVTKSEIIEQAEKMACDMNINDMDASNNWCNRFVSQHNLVINHARLPARLQPRSTPQSSMFQTQDNDPFESEASTMSTSPTPSTPRLSPSPLRLCPDSVTIAAFDSQKVPACAFSPPASPLDFYTELPYPQDVAQESGQSLYNQLDGICMSDWHDWCGI